MSKTNREKFSKDQIAEALEATGGIYTLAAAKLASITGRSCSANTVKNYVHRYKTLKALEEEILYQNVDIAESSLLKQIREGNTTAIIFYLKTKGKDRGYSERHEVVPPKGSGVLIVPGVIAPDEWLKMVSKRDE